MKKRHTDTAKVYRKTDAGEEEVWAGKARIVPKKAQKSGAKKSEKSGAKTRPEK